MNELEDSRILDSPDGWIAFISGPMFAGKSRLLRDILNRANKYGGREVLLFKPIIDDRHGLDFKTHDNEGFPCININHSSEIESYVTPTLKIIGIDEVEFLDGGIIEACESLRERNFKVITAGLKYDSERKLFLLRESDYTTDTLENISDYPLFVRGVCEEKINGGSTCGRTAIHTRRNVPYTGQVAVGGKDLYSPTCTRHWRPAPKSLESHVS
jgi:thymidine kinase